MKTDSDNFANGRPLSILFSPIGTEGDVRPVASLAAAARERGHEVKIAVSPDHADLCESLGLRAVAVGSATRPKMEELGRAGNGKPAAAMRMFMELVRSNIAEQFEDLPRHLAGADLLVVSGIHFASHSIAAASGAKVCQVGHVPTLVPSRAHPPAGVPLRGLPGFVNRWLWKATFRYLDGQLRECLDQGRRRLGLAPIGKRFEDHMESPFLLAMDPELGPLPADAPRLVGQCGYWHRPSDRKLSDRVERFLAAGDPPVYAGFGSMFDAAPRSTAEIVVEAARRAGRRVVVSEGWAGLVVDPGDDVLAIGHEPHEALFPRMAAVVHHGGAGTTWTAARSGVPQVVVPHLMDQPWWADRVGSLGLGPRPISYRKLSVATLETALRRATDPALVDRCARFARPLRARDGLAEGVRLLEEIARG